jgi:hypothetical protein
MLIVVGIGTVGEGMAEGVADGVADGVLVGVIVFIGVITLVGVGVDFVGETDGSVNWLPAA